MPLDFDIDCALQPSSSPEIFPPMETLCHATLPNPCPVLFFLTGSHSWEGMAVGEGHIGAAVDRVAAKDRAGIGSCKRTVGIPSPRHSIIRSVLPLRLSKLLIDVSLPPL
jgi:hypothetical protein